MLKEKNEIAGTKERNGYIIRDWYNENDELKILVEDTNGNLLDVNYDELEDLITPTFKAEKEKTTYKIYYNGQDFGMDFYSLWACRLTAEKIKSWLDGKDWNDDVYIINMTTGELYDLDDARKEVIKQAERNGTLIVAE